MIRFELVDITPDKAAEMLTRNRGNRKVTENQVRQYAVDMQQNNWRITHQPVAIGSDGNLIDGQHRLHAIVKSGVSVNMYVAHYSTSESVLSLPIDVHKKRSVTDIISCSPRISEVVNTMYWIWKQRAATSAEAESLIELMSPYVYTLHNIITARPKVRGSAGVRAGVLYRMLTDPENSGVYAELYRDFCLLNFDNLNSSAMAFVKTCENMTDHNVGQNGRNALFAKTVYAFDLSEQGRKIIRISKESETEILNEFREWADGFILNV